MNESDASKPSADQGSEQRSKVLSSVDFMQFLAKQSISQLDIITKNGDRVRASFSGDQSSVFKSIDMLDKIMDSGSANKSSADFKSGNVYCEYFPSSEWKSKDWHTDYAKTHVDVSYDNCFPGSQSSAQSSGPPKKGKFDYQGIFDDALSPLVEAAEMHSQAVAEDDEKKPPPKDTKSLTKQCKRKPRKVIPVNKEYVDEYADSDILFGRGGRSNHHPGNKLYRDFVTDRQPYYRGCDKNEKTKVAQSIVDMIQGNHNGRFLELDKESNRWYIVPNIVARRKVGQALRENNTEEARAAKREKYGQGKPKKKA